MNPSSPPPPNPNTHCLLLTGYMGAGKSTVGRVLAKKLGYAFRDTDRVLTRHFGKSITQVFKEEGEAAFRSAELEVVDMLTKRNKIVISAGGGTLVRDDTFNIAKAHGLLIYLRLPLEDLYERVIFSPKDRPMIDVPDAEKVFKERFAQRQPYYEKSHIIVDTRNRPTGQVVDEIIGRVEAYELEMAP